MPRTTPPPLYPEARIRRVFPVWDDQKKIMEAWSAGDDTWRAGLVKLVEGGDDRELPRQIADYLDSPSPDEDAESATSASTSSGGQSAGTAAVATAPPGAAAPDETAGQGGSSTSSELAAGDDGRDDQGDDDPGGGQEGEGQDGTAESDAEITAALKTAETAKAFARAHPDRIGDLLAAERARPKTRSTVVDELETAQRVYERERAREQGE